MKRKSLILPVVLAALLISGCNRKGTTEPSNPSSTSSTSSQTSSETSSQGTSVSESSEETSSSTSSSEEQGAVYTVTIGEVTHDLAEGEAPQGYSAQYYVEGLTVTKGQVLAFKESGVNLNVHKDNEGDTDESKCNAVANQEGDFVIHNDATNVGVYLKLDADLNWAFWVTGYVTGEGDEPPTPELTQYLYVSGETEWTKVALVANPNDDSEVMAEDVELAKDQEFVVCMGQDDWRKYDDLKTECEDISHLERVEAEGKEGNIKVKDAGLYDFYIKKSKGENQKTIWVVYEEKTTPVPEDAAISVKINNGEAQALAKNEEATLAPKQVAEYTRKITVAKDDELSFFIDNVAATKYGANADKEDQRNNVQGDDAHNEGKLVVLAAGTDLDLYVQTWNDGGLSMWLEGGPEVAKVAITFQMTKDVGDGNSLYVIGTFCDWALAEGVKLNWAEGNVWSGSKEFAVGSELSFKFVIAATENPSTIGEWENLGDGVNRTFTVSEAATITATWGVLPTVIENWYLVGSFNSWNVEDTTYKLDLHEDKKDDADQYAIHDVTLTAGDEIKFVKDNDYDKGQYPASGNINVVESGVYNIYFVPSKDISDWGGNRYYLDRTGDAVHTYGLVGSFGGVDKWNLDQAMTVNEGVATIENVAMAANDEFRVRADGAWAISYGWTNVNAMTEGKFVVGSENNNIKCAVDGNYDIKLTIATGKLMLKVNGGADPEVNTTVTFTITGIPAWVANDGAVILVWAWGGAEAGAGKWYEVTWTPGEATATVTLPNDVEHFKVVRFPSGTTTSTADWGNKYNEGSNIDVTNETSYGCGL